MATPYDNESYMQSLLASEQDVRRQVQNALNEIERRRAMALDQLALAAQEQGRVFDATERDYTGSLADLAANLDRYGGLFRNLSGYDPSAFVGALGTLRQGFGQANTALGQGFGEQATQRANYAETIRSELLNQIAQQRAQYIAQREAEDRAREEAARQAEAARQFQLELQQMQYGGGGGGGGYSLPSLPSMPPAPRRRPPAPKRVSPPAPKYNKPTSAFYGALPGTAKQPFNVRHEQTPQQRVAALAGLQGLW